MAAAEHQFKLTRCGDDGISYGEKLRHIEATKGKRPADLDGPELPLQTEHVWVWFQEISQGRTGNGFGPNPLTWGDIEAWMRLTGTEVRPWEVTLLKALDRTYLASTKKEN